MQKARVEKQSRGRRRESVAETLVFRAESKEAARRDERVRRREGHGWEVVHISEVSMPRYEILPTECPDHKYGKYLVKMELEV